VASFDALPGAFKRALEAGKPFVIDVEVEYSPHPMDFMWNEIILLDLQFPDPSKIKAVA
jgi:thiamine pyrophosphate-dependent acetolactate synthase large subunit-like protein